VGFVRIGEKQRWWPYEKEFLCAKHRHMDLQLMGSKPAIKGVVK